MSSIFFSLPCELRNQIYELVLSQQEMIDPWIPSNDRRQKLNLELLSVNKTIYREASALFYAKNRFDFSMGTPGDVPWTNRPKQLRLYPTHLCRLSKVPLSRLRGRHLRER